MADGIHFAENSPFNVGNSFTWDENDVSKAMDLAATKAKTPNPEGEKLASQFTYEKSVDDILLKIEAALNKK
jgi:hypothetical protein